MINNLVKDVTKRVMDSPSVKRSIEQSKEFEAMFLNRNSITLPVDSAFECKVTSIGNGGHIVFKKRFIGRRVVVIVL